MVACVHTVRLAQDGLGSRLLMFVWEVSAYQEVAVLVMKLDLVPSSRGVVQSCAPVFFPRISFFSNVGCRELDGILGHLYKVIHCYVAWLLH